MNELNDKERRIVEIVKAMLIPADFVVLDEPFRGMADEEKKRMLDYIMNKLGTRPLLLSQRDEPDPRLLG